MGPSRDEISRDNRLKEQVELIRQVFEYTHVFKGKTFVIKIDWPVIDHPFFPILVRDLVLLHRQGIQIILVPGAKQRIDEVLLRYGIEWKTVDGTRISTPESIPFIKMAAFDVSNRLMTQLAENNAHGVIGNWVKARSIGVRDGIDYQSTGIVDRVNIEIIGNIVGQGLIPIFPTIGWSARGVPYNISSSELAYTLACTLSAEKLFFLTEHTGICVKRYQIAQDLIVSDDGIVTQLTVAQSENLLAVNTKKREYDETLELLSFACEACKKGVRRVHIVNGEIEGVMLKEVFSNRGSGTMVYANLYENIRDMKQEDIPDAVRIMQPYVDKEILLPRSKEDLEKQYQDYVVYVVDGLIHACGALHDYGGGQGEIAAVAVDRTYLGFGIGRRITSFLMERAHDCRITKLFVLTTQSSDWFQKFGFKDGGVADLPEVKRALYSERRNSRVLVHSLE